MLKPNKSGFCPLSLEDWLILCKKTNIPYVEGIKIAEFEVNDIKVWILMDLIKKDYKKK